jgi:hypothetical protein
MKDPDGGCSIMMWAAVSNDGKTDLVHVPGNLTAIRYRDEILQPHLMHVIDRQRKLFQQDNARPHTASKYFSYTFRYRLRMFIIEKLTVHTSEDRLKKTQFITVQHTSGHVKVSTVYDQHARQTLLCTSQMTAKQT